MERSETPIVKMPLFSWIFKGNRKFKLLLVVTVCATVLVRVVPLEMQKRIVNQTLHLKAFELLLIYCGLYLAAVIIAGGLKFVIAYLQTIIGQRALSAMRKELYRHVLTLPLGFFRKTQPGMVVQSFVSELATAGDFVGMAVAIPVTSVLSLVIFTVYLLWLNPILAVVSFVTYPAAIFILPMLQKRANAENKKRNESEWSQLQANDQEKLLELALRFAPGRHKMIELPDGLRRKILKARTRFREKIAADFPGAFSFYRKSEFLSSHTILNNLFFGKFKTNNPQIQDAISEQVVQLLIEEDALETILEIGMQFQVGSKGDRLSGGQRQKIAIGRALLKKPNILIMDEATSALDNRSQKRIQSLLDTYWKGKATLIAVVHRLDIIKGYDKIGVMKSGKIKEMGTYQELIEKKGLLYELISGKR